MTPDITIARLAGTLSGTILNRFYVIPESLLEQEIGGAKLELS